MSELPGDLLYTNDHEWLRREDDGTVYECDAVLLLTVQPTEPPPAPPTNVAASDGSFTDRVRVTWTPVGNATHYEVWRGVVDDTTNAALFLCDSQKAGWVTGQILLLDGGYSLAGMMSGGSENSDFSKTLANLMPRK